MAVDSQFFGNLGGGIGSIAGGIGDFYAASGYALESNTYKSAATLAQEEAQQEQANVELKSYLTERQAYSVEGTQQARLAGQGFQANSGSGYYLLADSIRQSQLNTAMIRGQGAINEAAYEQQALSAEAQAKMATEEASAKTLAGIGAVVGGVLKLGAAGASLG